MIRDINGNPLEPPSRGKGGSGVRGVKGSGDSKIIAQMIAKAEGFPKICYTWVVWSVRHNGKEKKNYLVGSGG